MKASQRQARNSITNIRDESDVLVKDVLGIERVLKKYFMDLFTSSRPSRVEEATELVRDRLADAHRVFISAPFTAT